jgi:hypothetical protein
VSGGREAATGWSAPGSVRTTNTSSKATPATSAIVPAIANSYGSPGSVVVVGVGPAAAVVVGSTIVVAGAAAVVAGAAVVVVGWVDVVTLRRIAPEPKVDSRNAPRRPVPGASPPA